MILYMLVMFALMGVGFFLIIVQPIPGSIVIGIGFIVAAFYVAWRGRMHRKRKMQERTSVIYSDEYQNK